MITNPIAIFGGTFNPIHYGHLRLAEEWRQVFALPCVHLLPAGLPPHRPAPRVSPLQRLAMVRLAIEGDPCLKVDTRDVLKSSPCYSIETVQSLRQEFGATRPIYWLMGADSFLTLPQWEEWQTLMSLVHIVVARRPSYMLDAQEMHPELAACFQTQFNADWRQLQGAGGGITQLASTALAISSTQIRGLCKKQQSIRYLLPNAVMNYIETHKLYLG